MDIPAELYRGVTVPIEEITEELFAVDLVPGSDEVDESGERVVHDGNEWGVYMSDNLMMVQGTNYSRPRHGVVVPDSPTFCKYPYSPEQLEYPAVGVVYAIATHGLPVRRPKITNALQGVYNNGFAGDEWIADSVPAANYHPIQFTLAAGTLNVHERIAVGDDVAAGIAELQGAYALHKARHDEFGAAILVLPEARRRSPTHVGLVIARFKA